MPYKPKTCRRCGEWYVPMGSNQKWCKGCAATANLEAKREHNRRYSAANTDIIKERKRRYYAANTDIIKERKRRYYAANKEEIKERQRRHYAANKENERKRRVTHPATAEQKAHKQLYDRAYHARPGVAARIRRWRQRQPLANPAYAEQQREYQRRKYHTDPEWRAKRSAAICTRGRANRAHAAFVAGLAMFGAMAPDTGTKEA